MRLVLALFVVLTGCSSVSGSAIRTGPVRMPSYAGPVAIYAASPPPPGAVDLGVVEVHAAQQEGTVDQLLPRFVAKVAEIGGNVAVIEGTRARFDLAGRSHVENFYYSCNLGATCGGTRVYSTTDEILTLTMFGHAMTTNVPDTGEQRLIPLEPAPPPEPEEPPESEEPPAAIVPEASLR